MALSDNLVSVWKLEGNGNDSHGSYHLDQSTNPLYEAAKEGSGFGNDGGLWSSVHRSVFRTNAFHNFGTQSFTVSFWHYGGNTISVPLVSFGGGANGMFVVDFNGGVYYARFYDASGGSQSVGFSPSGSTNHIVAAVEVSPLGAYRVRIKGNNGTWTDSAWSADGAISSTNPLNFSCGAAIGESFNSDCTRDTSASGWNGWIDEVAVWSRLLRDEETYGLYNNGTGVFYNTTHSNFASSIVLTSSSDYLYIPVANQTGLKSQTDITVMAWIKVSADTGTAQIIYDENGMGSSDPGISMWLEGMKLRARVRLSGSGDTTATGATTLSTGQWYRVAAVYDDTNKRIAVYVNGVEDGYAVGSGTQGTGNTMNPSIGRRSQSDQFGFQGNIHAVRYFNRVLSTTEMDNYFNQFRVSDANLQAEWLVEGDLTDATANANHLTQVANPSFSSDTPVYQRQATIANTVSLSPTTTILISKSLSEALSLSQSITPLTSKRFAQTISAASALAREAGKRLPAPTSIAAALSRSLAKTPLANTTTLSGTTTASSVFFNLLSEAVSAASSIATLQNRHVRNTVALAQSLYRATARTAANVLSLTSAISHLHTFYKRLLSTLSLTSAVEFVKTFGRIFTNAVHTRVSFSVLLNGLNALWTRRFHEKLSSLWTRRFTR